MLYLNLGWYRSVPRKSAKFLEDCENNEYLINVLTHINTPLCFRRLPQGIPLPHTNTQPVILDREQQTCFGNCLMLSTRYWYESQSDAKICPSTGIIWKEYISYKLKQQKRDQFLYQYKYNIRISRISIIRTIFFKILVPWKYNFLQIFLHIHIVALRWILSYLNTWLLSFCVYIVLFCI